MKENKVYWKKAIELLKSGELVSPDQIDFNEEDIPVQDVMLLNDNGIRVPENLIFYDDDNIDTSDIPELDDKFWKKAKPVIHAQVMLSEENYKFINQISKPFQQALNDILDVHREIFEQAKAELEEQKKAS